MTKEELRQRRKALGYSQKQMGALLNIPWRTYAKWETGERGMSSIVQSHIAQQISKLETKKKLVRAWLKKNT